MQGRFVPAPGTAVALATPAFVMGRRHAGLNAPQGPGYGSVIFGRHTLPAWDQAHINGTLAGIIGHRASLPVSPGL